MKILAIEKEITSDRPENYETILADEARFVWQLQQEGTLREIYFNQNKNAVLILECENINAAQQCLSNFPLVKNKLIQFEINELQSYTGFERLFK